MMRTVFGYGVLGEAIRVITKLPNSEQSYKGKVKILFLYLNTVIVTAGTFEP
jgi:hypothetical protein